MDATFGPFSLPESWRFYAATLGAMIGLAGLDFVGALFAKEWAERGRLPMFLLGWLSFSVLFFVYARILKVAELSTVTIGWIVFLQVGLLALDALHYGVAMPRGKILAIAGILVLQMYLILAPVEAHEPNRARISPVLPEATAIIPHASLNVPESDRPHLLIDETPSDHIRSRMPEVHHLRRPLGPKTIPHWSDLP